MLKKVFSLVGVISLICFSFYYTNFAITIIKRNDPIMKEIMSISGSYKTNPVNAILINDNIIPGISGEKIDIDKSYENMKKYGAFNESLIVFEDVLPEISISNIRDKYINNGNDRNNKVSLIFSIDNYSYIEEILNILNSKNVKIDFFISENIIEQSNDIISLLNKSNQNINILGKYSDDNIMKNKSIIRRNSNQNTKFCLLNNENDEQLKICSKNKMYTIIPTIITMDFPYNDVKNEVKSGSIILLKNNSQTLKELKYIINYINQKGYQIVSLNELIKE